ncbi:MAG: hypothetical protein ACYC0H_02765 [Solirubrobacteraceae bacterium]
MSPLAGANYATPASLRDRYIFTSQAADSVIERFVRSWVELEPAAGATARESLTMDDFYLLMSFARRCVEANLQGASQPTLTDALAALSALDLARVDFRDAIVNADLLAWAMHHLGMDFTSHFQRAAKSAEPGMAEVLRKSGSRATKQLGPGMWQAVETALGRLLVDSDFRPWDPTADVIGAIFHVADAIERDSYRGSSLTVGQVVPEVWLKGATDPTALTLALRRTRAVASVRASISEAVCATSENQMFVAWVAEADNENDASTLAAAAKPSASHAAFGVASERLACIVVARSIMVGVASFETPDSLVRFMGPISQAIAGE